MRGEKSGQPIDDKCLDDYTAWQRFYNFLSWDQFCKLFHTSEKFKGEIIGYRNNPTKDPEFPKASVENGVHMGIFVVKPVLGLTAAEVKRETTATAKKLKLQSIIVPDPSTGDNEELFLMADGRAPFKRVFPFVVVMDGKRTANMNPEQHVLESQADELLKHLIANDGLSADIAKCFKELPSVEASKVKVVRAAAKSGSRRRSDIGDLDDLKEFSDFESGEGDGASDAEDKGVAVASVQPLLQGLNSASCGIARGNDANPLVDQAASTFESQSLGGAFLLSRGQSVQAASAPKSPRSAQGHHDIERQFQDEVSREAGLRPSPSKSVGEGTSASGWAAVPKLEVDKCDYWIKHLDLNAIVLGETFGRALRQAKDLLKRNGNSTDSKITMKLNEVKVHLGLANLAERIATDNAIAMDDTALEAAIQILSKAGVDFTVFVLQRGFLARKVSRFTASQIKEALSMEQCKEVLSMTVPWRTVESDDDNDDGSEAEGGKPPVQVDVFNPLVPKVCAFACDEAGKVADFATWFIRTRLVSRIGRGQEDADQFKVELEFFLGELESSTPESNEIMTGVYRDTLQALRCLLMLLCPSFEHDLAEQIELLEALETSAVSKQATKTIMALVGSAVMASDFYMDLVKELNKFKTGFLKYGKLIDNCKLWVRDSVKFKSMDVEEAAGKLKDLFATLPAWAASVRVGTLTEVKQSSLERLTDCKDMVKSLGKEAAGDSVKIEKFKKATVLLQDVFVRACSVFPTDDKIAMSLKDLQGSVQDVESASRLATVRNSLMMFSSALDESASTSMISVEAQDMLSTSIAAAVGLACVRKVGVEDVKEVFLKFIAFLDKAFEGGSFDGGVVGPQLALLNMLLNIAPTDFKDTASDITALYVNGFGLLEHKIGYNKLGSSAASKSKGDPELTSLKKVMQLSDKCDKSTVKVGKVIEGKGVRAVILDSMAVVAEMGEFLVEGCHSDMTASVKTFDDHAGGVPGGDRWTDSFKGASFQELLVHADKTLVAEINIQTFSDEIKGVEKVTRCTLNACPCGALGTLSWQ